jgi:uncharacterized membrane protein YeaQ/YmgE (transglycosylase-associated protein family)
MNFLFAVLIGAVLGAVVGYLLRQRNSRALVFGPVAGIVGALIASVLATLFGDAGYGPKEVILQVVLAAGAAAAAVYFVPADIMDRAGAARTTE